MYRLTEHPARSSNDGFTLVELIIVIVVLSTGLLGILAVYQQTVVRSADPLLQQQALAIAEAHMDEILGRQCDTSSTESGDRRDWLWMRDYHELDNSPPQDILGNGIDLLEGYRVVVAVVHGTNHLADNVPTCRVDVTVSHDTHAGVRVVLSGFRAEDAPAP